MSQCGTSYSKRIGDVGMNNKQKQPTGGIMVIIAAVFWAITGMLCQLLT